MAGTISTGGVILNTYSEVTNFKRKDEMSKFAYMSYDKVLTVLRSFLRGVSFNDKQYLDYVKVLDDIIIDVFIIRQI